MPSILRKKNSLLLQNEGNTVIWRSAWQNGLFEEQGLKFKSGENLLPLLFKTTEKITLNQKIPSYSVKNYAFLRK
jgi:hypothetical protein